MRLRLGLLIFLRSTLRPLRGHDCSCERERVDELPLAHARSYGRQESLLARILRGAVIIGIALAGTRAPAGATPGAALEAAFRAPPFAARPWVFWYWMNASSSRAGITADLEAMKAAGIGGAHLVMIRGAAKPSLYEPTAEQFTPEWWDHIKFALSEAERLGLRIAMHASDGYATAGGPWITPELAMQKIVSSRVELDGGRRVETTLPVPPSNAGFYRDVRVVAFPAAAGAGVTSRSLAPKITTSQPDTDAQFLAGKADAVFKSNEACWIQYAFTEPFTCRALTVRTPRTKGIQFNTYNANRLALEVSDDGEHFRRVTQLVPPRHGWQDGDADLTHSIPAVTARYFRFEYDPESREAGAEDLDSAKWKRPLTLSGIDLFAEPRIHQYEGKTGEVWRIAPATTDAQLPSGICVPLASIVDLSDRTDADGHLIWQAPPGRWTVLRLGRTTTGARNDTAGAGVGLECDKFNPVAARLMFEHWFGEIIRQAGPVLAGRVLKVFHVDSWECGSQNWSPVFAEEFQRRRGYDPLPYLPAMAGIPVESADVSERFLHDVRETIDELVRDNFFGAFHELASANGCTFSAECVAPTMTGDGLTPFGVVDTPMGEFWLRSPTHDKPNDVLDAISGAHIYGKPIVQAEAFTEIQSRWDETPAMAKAVGDRNYALGINRFVYHVFTHNPWMDRQPGMTLGGVGLYFQRDQTWWRPGRAWVEYAQRCQALLQQGKPVVDIAVFTGEDVPRRAVVPWHLATTLPGFFPENDPRQAKRIIEGSDWVDPLHGYAYDSINCDALLRLAHVRDGRIELPGGASYAVLVVPAANPMMPIADRLSAHVAERLKEFADAGVTVIVGERPVQSPGLRDARRNDATVARIADELWPQATPVSSVHAVGRGRVVDGPFRENSFESIGLAPDLVATINGQRAERVAWTHRTGDGWEMYFISNQENAPRELNVSLRTSGRRPELWDAVTGDIQEASGWRIQDGRTELPLSLPASGSRFVVLRRPAAGEHSGASLAAAAPRTIQTLPGQWEVAFDPVRGGPATPVTFPQLSSWTERPEIGIRHYSGTATYTQTFHWEAPTGAKPVQVWLDLGRVADLAEVTVNGVACGVAWTPPYRVEITAALRVGGNQLRVDVTNTWFNRLALDRTLPEEQRLTWTTAPERTAGKPLLAAGLLGPVTLLSETIESKK